LYFSTLKKFNSHLFSGKIKSFLNNQSPCQNRGVPVDSLEFSKQKRCVKMVDPHKPALVLVAYINHQVPDDFSFAVDPPVDNFTYWMHILGIHSSIVQLCTTRLILSISHLFSVKIKSFLNNQSPCQCRSKNGLDNLYLFFKY